MEMRPKDVVALGERYGVNMGTTKGEIRGWLEEGKRLGATHCLVVCDTFDYEDYPVYVLQGENVRSKYDELCEAAMSRVMEVYDLRMDIGAQLDELRAFHF